MKTKNKKQRFITVMILTTICSINAHSFNEKTTNTKAADKTLTESIEPITILSSLVLEEYINQIENHQNLNLTPLNNTELELKRKNYNHINSDEIAIFAKDYDSCKTRYKKLLEMHKEKEGHAKGLAFTGAVFVPAALTTFATSEAIEINKINNKINKTKNGKYYYINGKYYNPPQDELKSEREKLTRKKNITIKTSRRFGGTLLLLELAYLYYINEQGIKITDELRTLMIDTVSVVGVTVAACGSIKCEFEKDPERILQHRTKTGKNSGLDETVACEYIGASETISKVLHEIDIELSKQEYYTPQRHLENISETLDSLRTDK